MSAPPRRPPPGQGRSGRIVPALQAQARAPAEGDFNDPIPARAHMLRQLAAQGLRDAQVLRALGAVSVRTLEGVQESMKFPLPKGLKLDGQEASGLQHLR